MSSDHIFLTPEGVADLKCRLERLEQELLPEAAQRLRSMREIVLDSPEGSGEITEARHEVARIEANISWIRRALADAVIIDAPPSG